MLKLQRDRHTLWAQCWNYKEIGTLCGQIADVPKVSTIVLVMVIGTLLHRVVWQLNAKISEDHNTPSSRFLWNVYSYHVLYQITRYRREQNVDYLKCWYFVSQKDSCLQCYSTGQVGFPNARYVSELTCLMSFSFPQQSLCNWDRFRMQQDSEHNARAYVTP